MTEIEKSELRELIREVIFEERAEALAHPGRREKYTRYTDPEGKTWVSATMERAEVAQKLIALFLALCSLLSLFNWAVITYAVKPSVESEIRAEIKSHEETVRQRMGEIQPTLVSHAEFDAYVSAKGEKWRQQELFNARVDASLVEIQKDIKELLRRVR